MSRPKNRTEASAADTRADDTNPRYALFLDECGVATTTPRTRKVGTAETWEQLQSLARDAEPSERGGRLWAADRRNNAVLFMGDIRLNQNPLDAR